MSKIAYRIIDVLVILFIILNVLAFDIPIAGINLRYIVFALLLLSSFIVKPSLYFSKHSTYFVTVVLLFYAILSIYSLIIGNFAENIIIFIRPLLVLLAIPAFSQAFCRYGVSRYFNFFSLATIFLIIIFLYVFSRSILDFSFAQSLNDEEGLIFVNVHQILPRVVIKTFVFVIPFTIYVMNKLKGLWLHLFFIFMILICLLSQTLGIVITTVIIYFYVLKKRGENYHLLFSILLLLGIYLVFDTLYLDDIFASKEGSASIKSEQIKNIFKDQNLIGVLFGRGIGCVFSNFDSRLISEPIIEVAAVQIFQMGGFLFSYMILYVYLKPAIDTLKNKDDNIRIMSLCQLGVFFASMFNPYLWGGGTGLLFIVMIEAGLLRNKQIQC